MPLAIREHARACSGRLLERRRGLASRGPVPREANTATAAEMARMLLYIGRDAQEAAAAAAEVARAARATSNEQWAMGNGQWAMGNGQWAMGNGQAWRIRTRAAPRRLDDSAGGDARAGWPACVPGGRGLESGRRGRAVPYAHRETGTRDSQAAARRRAGRGEVRAARAAVPADMGLRVSTSVSQRSSGTQVRICHRRLTRNFREASHCLLTVFGSYEGSAEQIEREES